MPNSRPSFLWHDYETFGSQPLFDRPAQFAALRTDPDLNPIDEPITLYCAPADDVLPHPAACLITGITPQTAKNKGIPEAEFAARILEEMQQAGTCSAGYNSIRFDDVVTRNLLYRNLRDPYAREWKNGNSRWDLIDLLRMCYALRPDGLQWPRVERDGAMVPSFRLEDLTAENGIDHGRAHDALADVLATIELARRIRQAQPRLYEWALGMRQWRTAMKLLDPESERPFLHSTVRIPASRGCTTLELPLAVMPDRPKSVAVFDLMADPAPLIGLPADEIADRVFTPTADLPDDIERLPLKLVHSNHVPMLAPASTLKGSDPARIGLDPQRCMQHARAILPHRAAIAAKLIEVFARPDDEDRPPEDSDPDYSLYTGGFIPDADRYLLEKALAVPADELGQHRWSFQDARLPILLFRYRARNYPQSLSPRENQAWDEDRSRRLFAPSDDRVMSWDAFHTALQDAREQHAGNSAAQRLLDELQAWPAESGIAALRRDWEEKYA